MRIVVTGSAGFLGTEVARLLAGRGDDVVAGLHRTPGPDATPGVESRPLDVTDAEAVRRAVRGADAVVHTAYAKGGAGRAIGHPVSRSVNVAGTATVAEACARAGAHLVHVSSDVVFGGDRPPYIEDDPIAPVPGFAYGNEKADAERAVRAVGPAATIVRTSLLWDGHGGGSVQRMIAASAEPHSATSVAAISHFTDEFRCPVHVADVAGGIMALLDRVDAGRQPLGVVHLVGPERVSRLELATALAPGLGIDPARLRGGRGSDHRGPRPADLDLRIDLARAELGYLPRPLPGR